MGAEIDRLELQVETQATKANNQLDKLVGKLESLSNSLKLIWHHKEPRSEQPEQAL